MTVSVGTNEDGRVFTIVVTASDASGNGSSTSGQVSVAHDQGKRERKSARG